MRKTPSIKLLLASLCLLSLFSFSLSAQTSSTGSFSDQFLSFASLSPEMSPARDTAWLSLSHGHCSVPAKALLAANSVRFDERNNKDLKIDFTLNATSLVAHNRPDGHWTQEFRAEDAFDVEQYPSMYFNCHHSQPLGEKAFQLSGSLTLKGHTQPAFLTATPVYNINKAGSRYLQKFILEGKVNLPDFGITVGDGSSPSREMRIRLEVRADSC